MLARGDWNPEQYARFSKERDQPFYDLVGGLRLKPGGLEGARVLDLGCGGGRLTHWLHDRFEPAFTLGLDSSSAMLAAARAEVSPGLEFRRGDIARLEELQLGSEWDLVISNAALQWVDDHERLIPRLVTRLASGGRLAIQVPANHGHISHRLAARVALDEPFVSALGGWTRSFPVLEPARYAERLHACGGRELDVRTVVYAHELEDPSEVYEWVRGTLLLAYLERLPEELQEPYLARYRELLSTSLPAKSPYLYAFPRTLMSARFSRR